MYLSVVLNIHVLYMCEFDIKQPGVCSMQAPELRVQYEVWIGGLLDRGRQTPITLHPMTVAETMQSQYTFLGNFQNGFVMHTGHNVAWPFRIHYTSETGMIQLEISRNTLYVMHYAGIERGDIIDFLDEATFIKPGTRIEYPWGESVTFRWQDTTSMWNGGWDEITVMIKRPDDFASVRTDRPVQGELRELLSQLHLASRVDATWSEWLHQVRLHHCNI